MEDPSSAIKISRSDGSLDQAPSEAKGYELIPKGHKASRSWRATVGTFIAKHTGLDINGKAWYLEDWPSGYTMWVRKRENRADYYLFGLKRKFSSPREFAFHALWLYSSTKSDQCKCTVCTGRNQGEINEIELGELRGATSLKPRSQTTTLLPGARNVISSEGNTTIQVFRKQLEPVTSKDQPPLQRVACERDSDLRSDRIYRIGEIVWVPIPPLAASGHPHSQKQGATIRYWPALIQEQRTKCTAIGSTDHTMPFSVTQTNQCLVLCLGVMQLQIIEEKRIVPYLALQLHRDLEECIKQFSVPNGLSPDCRELRQFNPFIEDLPLHHVDGSSQSLRKNLSSARPERDFARALGPFALSLRTAKRAFTYWCPSHKWRFISQDGHSEVRWQGLFMGSERIWLGDLVRITCSRGDLEAADCMLPASPGAGERCLLVHISSIAADESLPTRVMFSGSLYEIAPEHWPEDSHLNPSLTNTSDMGMNQTLLSSLATGVSRYRLPSPPTGYKFRRVSAPGYEVCLPISFLAGRYYATGVLQVLLDHINLGSIGDMVIQGQSLTGIDHSQAVRLASLASLAQGSKNQLHCRKWKKGRMEMMQDADSTARTALYSRWSNTQIDEIDTRAFII